VEGEDEESEDEKSEHEEEDFTSLGNYCELCYIVCFCILWFELMAESKQTNKQGRWGLMEFV
jgi:hypothetical protein